MSARVRERVRTFVCSPNDAPGDDDEVAAEDAAEDPPEDAAEDAPVVAPDEPGQVQQLFSHASIGVKRRCYICSRSGQGNRTLTRLQTQCQICAKSACKNHFVLICSDCSETLQKKPEVAEPEDADHT